MLQIKDSDEQVHQHSGVNQLSQTITSEFVLARLLDVPVLVSRLSILLAELSIKHFPPYEVASIAILMLW